MAAPAIVASCPPVMVLEDPEQIFADLYRSHSAEIRSYCRQLVHDSETARDLMQDTFLKAWAAFAAFDGENPRAWLYKIARNTCVDHLRKLKPEDSLEKEIQRTEYRFDPPALKIADKLANDEWMEAIIRELSTDQLLAKLEPHWVTALCLRLEGHTVPEISEALGKHESTVWQWIKLSHDRMKEEVS